MWEAHGSSTAGPQEPPCRKGAGPAQGPLTVFLGRRLGSHTLTRIQVPFSPGLFPTPAGPSAGPILPGRLARPARRAGDALGK